MWPIVRKCTVSKKCAVQALSSTVSATYPVKSSTQSPPKPFSDIPGPSPTPFLGSVTELTKNYDRLQHFYHECFEKYGSIFKFKSVGSNYMVLLRDPAAIENVLRAEGKYPVRDTVFSANSAWLIKHRAKSPVCMPFKNGESWKATRVAAGKQIMPKNVQTYHSGISQIVDEFKDYIKSNRDENCNIADILPLMKLLLLNMSAKVVFGSDWDVVANPTAEDKEFIEAVEFVLGAMTRVIVELPWYKIYPNKFSREFKQAYEVINKRGMSEAIKILDSVAAGKTSKAPGLLEQWLLEGKMSQKDAIYEAVALFGAAVDSTSNQACFLLYEMARNCKVQEKLYQEICDVLGEDDLPTTEHLSQMPYMKGCLQESFRLHGTNAGFTRVTTEDTDLLGYEIPANTSVFYSIYSAGRDSSLFSNPLEFEPERWKRDKIHPYAVLPFGTGPRSCYGKRFAELELKLILVQMVKNFELTTELDDVNTVFRTFICPSEKVPVKFVDRK